MVFGWFIDRIRRRIEPEIEERLRKEIGTEAKQEIGRREKELALEYEAYRKRLHSETQEQVAGIQEKLERESAECKAGLQAELERKEKEYVAGLRTEYAKKEEALENEKQQTRKEFGELSAALQEKKLKEISEAKTGLKAEHDRSLESKIAELQRAHDEKDVTLKKQYEESCTRLDRDYEQKKERLKKDLTAEIEEKLKGDLGKQIRSRIEGELNKLYGDVIMEAKRVPLLKKEIRDRDDSIANMEGLVAKVRDTISPLYQQLRDAGVTVRNDEIEIVANYLKRDFDTTVGILNQMESLKKRHGYARCFFSTVNEIHKVAGDVDIEMLRRFVGAGLSIDDMRAVSIAILDGMKEWKNPWESEDYRRFVLAKSEKAQELVPSAREQYAKDEQHRDFCASLTPDERLILYMKNNSHGGKWEEYNKYLKGIMGGKNREVEAQIFSENQIVEFLKQYEERHKVDLSTYTNVS